MKTRNNLLLDLDDVARRIGCCTLYRYRPINPYEIDALKKGYLWFSSADDLNDPFEGSIKLKEVEQDTTMEIGLKFNIRVNGGAPKVEEKIFEIPNLIRQSNDYYKRVFQSMLAQTKVCCFSKSKTDKLMWSHYADKHKGMIWFVEKAKCNRSTRPHMEQDEPCLVKKQKASLHNLH